MNLSQITCRIESGGDTGTAFLISNKYAITVYHVLENENDIRLYFTNSEDEYRGSLLSQEEKFKKLDIALIELDDELDIPISCFPIICSRELETKEVWSSRGFPKAKSDSGYIFNKSCLTIHQQLPQLQDGIYDLELNHDLVFQTYEGISGAPIVIGDQIVGVINSELSENHNSKEFKAISMLQLSNFLDTYNIPFTIEKKISVKDDISGAMQWDEVLPSDKRNLSEKLKAVCEDISELKIRKLSRDLVSGKTELSIFPDRRISALKYRIFEVCQDELIKIVDREEVPSITPDKIDQIIDIYSTKAAERIDDKSVDYDYPLKNKDVLRKIILDLINECYLSFDKEGIYDEE